MTVFTTTDVQDLATFANRQDQLAIAERTVLPDADAYFAQLMNHDIKCTGLIHRNTAPQNIQSLLANALPEPLQSGAFYHTWIADMAGICTLFADIQGTDSVGFWLDTKRGCRLYHIDHVPLRLLVTYAGQGTEWIPEAATNRAAIARGERDTALVLDPQAARFLNPWDVAIFRGGEGGLLHRTPTSALNAPSLLMRLDHPAFWQRVMKPQHPRSTESISAA